MADYYPLLARALDALPEKSPAMRRVVYERARNALIGQLRSLEPPLAEADVEAERVALDTAIARLEADHAVAQVEPPAPPSAASLPAPLPDPLPEPLPPAAEPLPEPALPPAPPPDLAAPAPPPGMPAPAVAPAPPVPIAPRRNGPTPPPPANADAPDGAADSVRLGPPPIPRAAPSGAPPADGGARARPRIAVGTPRGRGRALRNLFVGTALALVIGLIAVAAYLLRDKPAELQPAAETARGQPGDSDAKFGDRLGGDGAAGEARPSAPARQPTGAPQPDVAVAQRAKLYEERPATDGAEPGSFSGRTVWRLESVSGERGQPLETAVVATVTLPEAGLTLAMTIQRNLDATLPASHTINLAFTTAQAGDEKRVVQEIGLLQAKDDENARGSPVAGLPIRVRDNLFLIGLSAVPNDVERNTGLLQRREWFDLGLLFTSGKRAVLTFEKGSSGGQVMQRAFEAWR